MASKGDTLVGRGDRVPNLGVAGWDLDINVIEVAFNHLGPTAVEELISELHLSYTK